MDHSEVKHLPKVDHTPAELDVTSQMLLKAASIIERLGHCQNGLGHDARGGTCVMLALAQCGLYTQTIAAEQRLNLHIPEVPGKHELSKVARWSDGTPTAEVLAKLRAVALSA